MRRWIGLGLTTALVLGAAPAFAQPPQDAGSYGALALGAIVGSYSPLLTASQKAVLARVLAGQAAPYAADVTIRADEVHCSAGDVALAAFTCALKFGAATRRLSGRAANELFATMGEAGVQDDGAAGTIHHAITNLRCVISPHGVAQNDGGGASCSYKAD